MGYWSGGSRQGFHLRALWSSSDYLRHDVAHFQISNLQTQNHHWKPFFPFRIPVAFSHLRRFTESCNSKDKTSNNVIRVALRTRACLSAFLFSMNPLISSFLIDTYQRSWWVKDLQVKITWLRKWQNSNYGEILEVSLNVTGASVRCIFS